MRAWETCRFGGLIDLVCKANLRSSLCSECNSRPGLFLIMVHCTARHRHASILRSCLRRWSSLRPKRSNRLSLPSSGTTDNGRSRRRLIGGAQEQGRAWLAAGETAATWLGPRQAARQIRAVPRQQSPPASSCPPPTARALQPACVAICGSGAPPPHLEPPPPPRPEPARALQRGSEANSEPGLSCSCRRKGGQSCRRRRHRAVRAFVRERRAGEGMAGLLPP